MIKTECLLRTNIEAEIKVFKKLSNPEDRYSSFDYCYNYFIKTDDLTKDVEKSCLFLGFYLASWGMFSGYFGDHCAILGNSSPVISAAIVLLSIMRTLPQKKIWQGNESTLWIYDNSFN